jgi:hypothetical protein
MAGGERERKGKKKVEARFNDRKKPKERVTKDESKALALKKEGFCMRLDKGESFLHCPRDGSKLKGKNAKCPKCAVEWAAKFISTAGPSIHCHLVDSREYHAFWRKKFYWRLSFTFHTGVTFTTDPPSPFSVYDAVFALDYQEAAYRTGSGVRTHIRILETTRAVEDFCRFNLENESKGSGAAKLFGSGEIVMVCPPVEVTHIESPVSGSKVHFKFGWVSMTARGLINHAENMPEPAEGWAHVDARVRDHAFNMLDCELDVSLDMVICSEAQLRSQYESDKAFLDARSERENRDAHYIMPRPQKALAIPEAVLPVGEYYFPEVDGMHEDINAGMCCHNKRLL